MTLRVFVSATTEDLKPDCRPAVRKAIKISNGFAETMEDWNPEFRKKPVQLCKQALEIESTHYIGVFAHRRGWVVPELAISITEAEFNWALDSEKPMAIFMPEQHSEIDRKLKAHAEKAKPKQTKADADAQAAFRRRVADKGTFVTFGTCVDLGILVSNRVTLWAKDGLRNFAAAARPAPESAHATIPPVHLLGRKKQVRDFEDAWEMLAELGLPKIACFVVAGEAEAGQAELIKRLALLGQVGGGATTMPAEERRYCKAAIGATWRETSLNRLLHLLGNQLRPGWQPRNPEELTAELELILNQNDVVLEIHDAQRFHRSIPGLIEELWQPILAAFKRRPRHRCMMFIAAECSVDQTWDRLLYRMDRRDELGYANALAFALPELANFSLAEIKQWLGDFTQVADPDWLAATLHQESKSGNPVSLLNKLKNKPLT